MNSVSTATKLAPSCRRQKRVSISLSVITVIADAIHRKLVRANRASPFSCGQARFHFPSTAAQFFTLPARNRFSDLRFLGDGQQGARLLRWRLAVQAVPRRQATRRTGYGGDALDDGRSRYGYLTLFERGYRKPRKACEQFARTQQEIGITGLTEALVAESKGLVDHDPTARQGVFNRGQQRPVQIVGHDDPVIALAERPGRAGLEVQPLHLAARSGERQKRRDVTVDCENPEPVVKQQPRVATGAGGQIKHEAVR